MTDTILPQKAAPDKGGTSELLAYAKAYHRAGLVPVPVRQGQPLVAWRRFSEERPPWSVVERLPWRRADGLAVVVGHACPAGGGYWWVLDIEPEHVAAASAWLDEHCAGWRESVVAASQRHGVHLYCRSERPARTGKCAFGDLKGTGGLIYAPPSRAFKPDATGDYRWLSAPPLERFGAEAPWRAIELDPSVVPGVAGVAGVAARADGGEGLAVGANGHGDGDGGRHTNGPLDVAQAVAGVPKGQRHDHLFRLACKLRALGFSPEEAEAVVTVAAQRCSPPWGSLRDDRESVEALVERVFAAYPPGRFDSTAVYSVSAVKTNFPGPSGPSGSSGEAPPPVSFRSVGELLAATPEQVQWLWPGVVARGAVTVLGGREKSGKSTLTWALIAAVLRGEDFCGQPTAQTPVVVLTEEPPATVAEKLRRFGIKSGAPLSVATRADVRGRPNWEAVVAAAGAEAERLGAGLVVADTMSYWAALPPDAENDAGAMTAALRPLLELAGRGFAVVVVHHANKAHGELRGSTAIGAMADIIVTFSREAEAPTRRRLEAAGRYAECPTEPVLVELSGDGGGYVALGTPREVSAEERERLVLAALPTPGAGGGLTQREVAELTRLPQQRVAEALARLVARGEVVQVGRGARGDPHRYVRAGGGEFDFTADTLYKAVKTNSDGSGPGRDERARFEAHLAALREQAARYPAVLAAATPVRDGRTPPPPPPPAQPPPR